MIEQELRKLPFPLIQHVKIFTMDEFIGGVAKDIMEKELNLTEKNVDEELIFTEKTFKYSECQTKVQITYTLYFL